MRAILTLLMVSGCSVALVEGPPAHPAGSFECTDSRVAPGIDLGIAGATGILGVAGLLARDTCDPNQQSCLLSGLAPAIENEVGAFFVGTAIVFALSSWYGFSETEACRRAPSSSPVARAPS